MQITKQIEAPFSHSFNLFAESCEHNTSDCTPTDPGTFESIVICNKIPCLYQNMVFHEYAQALESI